jgi:C4-dicarboxylate-binding protein DctP
MVEMLQAGGLEAGLIPTAKIAPIAPAVQVLDLPFLFPSRDVAYQVIDGAVGARILKPLEKVSIEGVAFWESGFKQFTGHFPIREPADYKGRKIRVMPAPVIVEQYRAFGATPVPIDFKELYNALQQKVVDGQENPLATNITMRFYEVQKHLTLSDHAFLAYVFLFSKTFLDRLPGDLRTILVDTAREAGRFERQLIAESEKAYLQTMRRAGVDIITLSPEQRAKFEQAARPVHDWYAKKYGGEVLEAIRNDIERVKGGKR